MTLHPKEHYCKKLRYGDPSSPVVLLGIIISQDEHFITFKTEHKEYTVSKSIMLALEDTDILFRDNGVQQ